MGISLVDRWLPQRITSLGCPTSLSAAPSLGVAVFFIEKNYLGQTGFSLIPQAHLSEMF